MAKTAHLTVEKKTTKSYQINFKEDGVSTSIEGWTVYFMVKEDVEDPDSSALISKTITEHEDEDNGETLIELDKTDTDLTPGTYYYSIDYKDSSDNEGVLFTGQFTIVDTVIDSRS